MRTPSPAPWKSSELCAFSLDELAYEYPDEPVPPGTTPQCHLEALTWAGAAQCYPDGIPAKVRRALMHELGLIAELGYAPYFPHRARRRALRQEQGHPLPGAGLGRQLRRLLLPGHHRRRPGADRLLFERFVSRERREPPDIDVDFEHERREEVIQYIYGPLRPRARRPRRHRPSPTGGGARRGTWARPWGFRRTRPQRSPARSGRAPGGRCRRPPA